MYTYLCLLEKVRSQYTNKNKKNKLLIKKLVSTVFLNQKKSNRHSVIYQNTIFNIHKNIKNSLLIVLVCCTYRLSCGV